MRLSWLLLIGLPLWLGCSTCKPHVHESLKDSARTLASEAITHYRLACPDMVEVMVEGLPQISGPTEVRTDGTIELGWLGPVLADGLTVTQLAERVAEAAGVPSQQVRVRVIGYHSRRVVVYGAIAHTQRTIDYRGPERVSELLRRMGGLKPGADTREVFVVRPQVARGKAPEIFRVQLEAVVNGDSCTDVFVEPFDHIYINESTRLRLAALIPPWLQPLYCRIWGLELDEATAKRLRRRR